MKIKNQRAQAKEWLVEHATRVLAVNTMLALDGWDFPNEIRLGISPDMTTKDCWLLAKMLVIANLNWKPDQQRWVVNIDGHVYRSVVC